MERFGIKEATLEILEAKHFPIPRHKLMEETQKEYGKFSERQFIRVLKQLETEGRLTYDEYGYKLKRG